MSSRTFAVSETNSIRIDKSLAKGLRSTIMRDLKKAQNARDLAAKIVVARRTTSPTTTKGLRRLFQDVNKVVRRYSMDCINNDEKGIAVWLQWCLVHGISIDNWEEDQLSIRAFAIQCRNGLALPIDHHYPVYLSMHFVERAFQRMQTTISSNVLKEIQAAIFILAGLSRYMEASMISQKLSELPIATFSSSGGLLLGSAVIQEDKLQIFGRTFLAADAELSSGQAALRDDLVNWMSMNSGVGWKMIISSINPVDDQREINPTLYEINQKVVERYCEVMQKHKSTLSNIADRRARAIHDAEMWKREL